MSKKNSTELSFHEKFKDRIENMGKDGVMGIIKTAENPIIARGEVNKMENWSSLYNQGKL